MCLRNPAKILCAAFVAITVLFPAWIAAAAGEPVRIVALGTSLTAGYGLPAGSAPPALLESKLRALGYDVQVENAGVSGDTSAGGLERLGWAVAGNTNIVIVELGGNDVLRGIDPAETRRNLDEILRQLTKRGVSVLLAGMLAAPNLGAEYADAFNRIYPDLAEKYQAALYPFVLEGVAAQPALNQADGIHPNAQGAAIIAQGLAEAVSPLIEAQRTGSSE